MVSTLIVLGVAGVQTYGIYSLNSLLTKTALKNLLGGQNNARKIAKWGGIVLGIAVGLKVIAHFVGPFALLLAPFQFLLSPVSGLALIAGVAAFGIKFYQSRNSSR